MARSRTTRPDCGHISRLRTAIHIRSLLSHAWGGAISVHTSHHRSQRQRLRPTATLDLKCCHDEYRPTLDNTSSVSYSRCLLDALHNLATSAACDTTTLQGRLSHFTYAHDLSLLPHTHSESALSSRQCALSARSCPAHAVIHAVPAACY